ncbi:nucleotidyl transferase AbiEii/AbiGii toxin family protein, partial [Arthrospira platensis SPKY1]|nr:nucleotidyl transferase AbiEii/AbiGii toxin family protein [Arthrospira platensis SPKY1]
MILSKGQIDLAKQYELMPFDVIALEPIRTLCEKIMSLVRFSYGQRPIEDLKQKIRHTYDLHQLLAQQTVRTFFYSPDFDIMLTTVANEDLISFNNNNQWLKHHPSEALIFSKLEQIWKELRGVYV